MTNYGFTKYGNTTDGYMFYDKQRDAIEATDGFIVSRVIFNLMVSLAQHAWVSFVGFAESINEAFHLDKYNCKYNL